MNCFLCKTSGKRMKLLNRNGLKCLKRMRDYKHCTDKDTFCFRCYEYVERAVEKIKAKREKKRAGSDTLSTISDATILRVLRNDKSSSSDKSSSVTDSSSDVNTVQYNDNVDQLVTKTPSHPQNKRIAIDVNERVVRSARRDNIGVAGPSRVISSNQEQLPSSQEQLISSQDVQTSQSSGLIAISQETQRPIVPIASNIPDNDSDDDVPPIYRSAICGPSSQVTQPIIRQRRTPITFPDPRMVPIYQRKGTFGG